MSTVGAAGLAGGVVIRDRRCSNLGHQGALGLSSMTERRPWACPRWVSHLRHTELPCAVIWPNQQSHLNWHLVEARCHVNYWSDCHWTTDQRSVASKHKYIFSPFLHVLRNVLWPSLCFWGQRLQRQTRWVEWRIREGWERHFITSREELGGAPCFIEKPQQKNIICGCFG